MNQAEIKRRQAGMLSEILSWLVIAFLGRVTGANGIAYLAAAWEAAELLWLLISGGTADTLGRLLRGRNTKGQYKNVMKMRRDILLLQAGFGILGSVLLFALSEWLMQDVFRMQYSSLILMILAPTVFLRSISETLTGCFRGEGTELPGTIAAFLRPVFILGFGLLFGKILAGYGNKVSALLLQLNFTAMYSSVGVAIAITVTELFLVLFLFLIYKGGPSPRAKIQVPFLIVSGFLRGEESFQGEFYFWCFCRSLWGLFSYRRQWQSGMQRRSLMGTALSAMGLYAPSCLHC